MNILNSWIFWVIVYLISALVFAQSFKKANRNMKDAGSLTILLEVFTALFAVLFIPLFKINFPSDINIYLTLLVVVIIYAITDRLNIEARYGLEPSTFSMLKQLSTVFLIILGIVFMHESASLLKIIGIVLIIFSNFLLTFEKGKIVINKYFVMSFISNFLFAVAMLINVGISDNFNLAIYTIITVSIPSLLIFIFECHSFIELKREFKLYDRKLFLLSAFTWAIMLISSVRAYQLGDIVLVAPLLALTSIMNAIYEVVINKDRKKFVLKVISAVLIVIGVLLIKM